MTGPLTNEELQFLQDLYRRHVKYHKWSDWFPRVRKHGRVHIGQSYILLPCDTRRMPHVLWTEMNRLYWEAMEEEARAFGCRLELEGEERVWLVKEPPQ